MKKDEDALITVTLAHILLGRMSPNFVFYEHTLFSCSCYTALLTKFSLERHVSSEVSNVLLIFKCAAAKLLLSPKSV